MNLINEHRFQEDSLACRHPKRSIPMAGARWKLLLQFTIKMSHGVCKTDVTISWPGGETQHYFSTCLKRLNMQPIIVIVDSLRFFRQESLQSLILDCDSFQAFTRTSPKTCSCCPADVPQTCFQRLSNSGFLCHRGIRASLPNWTWTDVD